MIALKIFPFESTKTKKKQINSPVKARGASGILDDNELLKKWC